MAEGLIPVVNVTFSSESVARYLCWLHIFQEREKYSSFYR